MAVPSVCLVVLDGWALAPAGPGNAISLADTPVMDRLWATYPHAQLRTCGPDVGLPPGQMGNSEVGHLNLGAGAIVKQDLLRIDEALAAREFPEVLRQAMRGAPRVHLIGLVSDGGVHASIEHLEALVELGRAEGWPISSCTRSPTGATRCPQRRRVSGSGGGLGRRADRLGDRALLRDGPRPALGPRGAGLRPARARDGGASRRRRG
ncbi:MAG: hypothetical protein R2736_13040 [Solirubrobacterales bacterium]